MAERPTGVTEVNQEILTFNHAARRPENGWFWIAAAVAILLASYAVPVLPFMEDGIGWRIFARLLAALCLPIGLGVLLIRQGTRVDGRSCTVQYWHGLLPFLRTHTVRFSEINEVKIRRLVLPSRHGRSHVFYSAMLIGPHPHVLITTDKDYAAARMAAEQAAAFLGTPLRDEAIEPMYREDGTAIETRPPETLDASLQQQAAVSGEAPPFPIQPGDCRIRVCREPGRYVFEMPVLRRSLMMALAVAVFSLAIAGALALMVMRNTEPEDAIESRLFFWALPVIIAVVGPTYAMGRGLNRRRQHETVAITPLALSREVRQCWSGRTVEVPIKLIEEFGYTPMAAAWARSLDAGRRQNVPMASAAISARTDFKRMYLGQGLRRSEQIWLHDVLKYLLGHTASGRASARNACRAAR